MTTRIHHDHGIWAGPAPAAPAGWSWEYLPVAHSTVSVRPALIAWSPFSDL